MKNRSLVVVFVLLALGAVAFAQQRNQCAFIKKNGQQCMNNAVEGSIYCSTHKKF
jgi:hypothetical protein